MGGVITNLKARTIIDSRGNPTVEVDCFVDEILMGRAAVPSGASTGSHEAVELRDGTKDWMGKGVTEAVNNVNNEIKDLLIGLDVSNQEEIDASMLTLDGTSNKGRLGANAILGASMSVIRAAANQSKKPLWSYISTTNERNLPVPLMNILNGGAHAASNVDVQEFMVVPHGFDSFSDALQAGTEIYHSLKSVLKDEGLLGGVGDEGGFAPNLPCNEDGLRYLMGAIEKAGYSPGSEISIALDVAAQEFFDGEKYHIDNRVIDGKELAALYSSWLDNYPIVSMEDPFGEDDWQSWQDFTKLESHRVQVVGDDLYVTNPSRLQRGIDEGASNAILIKLNQIGTVTETLQVIEMARKANFGIIISHRSGETSDDIIADISVGTNAGQIKTGAPARSDRAAKYNQLLRISEECPNYSKLFQ
ncbi:MAG: phosphopyruvate hydratase [Euryarchaeota archaeon]|nr:phosphopyruvate hydratase [Euryarchaeota archaeon]